MKGGTFGKWGFERCGNGEGLRGVAMVMGGVFTWLNYCILVFQKILLRYGHHPNIVELRDVSESFKSGGGGGRRGTGSIGRQGRK